MEEALQEIEETKEKLTFATQDTRKHNKTITELQRKLLDKTNEIERLKKIKWYQKLVGAQ